MTESALLSSPMRTTLTLDDDLAAELNRTARHTGRSFKDVVNAAIRRGLSAGDRPDSKVRPPFAVTPEACGFMAGIDPLRLNQLLDQQDLEDFADTAAENRESA
jgi:hypothetical protein